MVFKTGGCGAKKGYPFNVEKIWEGAKKAVLTFSSPPPLNGKSLKGKQPEQNMIFEFILYFFVTCCLKFR